jgi:hypothetical protein
VVQTTPQNEYTVSEARYTDASLRRDSPNRIGTPGSVAALARLRGTLAGENCTDMTAGGNYAVNNLGGYLSGMFDFDLPCFFGRHVYYGIENTTSPGGGTGPYVAYTSSQAQGGRRNQRTSAFHWVVKEIRRAGATGL